jgi:phage-related protein
MKREIILYTTADGKCPITDFFDSLPNKVFKKITWVLNLVAELEKIPSVYFKKLANSDDIYECRISFGSNIYRIFCFFNKGTMVILTHGIIKNTRKTPQDEIRNAENYKKDFLRRSK